MSKIDFGKYKDRLTDFMCIRGFDFSAGRMYSCPFHDDSTPSFLISETTDGQKFCCFGCGAKGDIYDAAGKFIGSEDKKAQFREVENAFAGAPVAEYRKPAQKKESAFTPDKTALRKFTEWLEGIQGRELSVLGYFQRRIEYKTGGLESRYPLDEIQLSHLAKSFLWWPGAKEAEKALGKKLLFRAGVPYLKSKNNIRITEEHDLCTNFPRLGNEGIIYIETASDDCYSFDKTEGKYKKIDGEPREIAWYHSGILARSAEGFKLLYMNENTFESEKRNPRTGVSFFPVPGEIPEAEPIILLEGEIDAVLCRTCGIKNAFSMGGLANLSVPKIKKYIIPKNIPEIILFADNDKAPKCQSQKAFGLMPYSEGDAVLETVPEKLIRAGYEGKIKVTSLAADSGLKDPDDAIRKGKTVLVREAIDKARDYTPFEKKDKETDRKPPEKTSSRLTAELVNQILSHKKLQKANMEADDADIFARAIINAMPVLTDEAKAALVAWGATEKTIESPGSVRAEKIISIMRTQKAPRALIEKVCAALDFEPPARKPRNKETVFPIDFAEIKKLHEWTEYLYSGQSQYAASICCHVFKDKLVYDNGKNQFFRYENPVWKDEPNVDKLVTDTITAIIDYFYPKADDKEKVALERYRKETGDKTFQRKVTDSIKKDTEHGIWKKTIEFDNPNITKETLTLLDGVLDFSQRKPFFRAGTPGEYRMQRLPFSCSELEASGEPVKYNEFMRGNFKDDSTLEMFERFISLIPARSAQFKIAAFLNGESNTGKSTTMKVLKSVYTYWQEYPVGEPESLIKSIPSDIVLKERNQTKADDGRSPTLASIVNAGCAFCDETDNMQKIDAKLFKRFTGGSTISFRDNYESMKEHSITAQLVLGTNELPDIITPGDGKLDEAILARIMVVPFLVKHERSVSGDITESIREEYPAIIMRYAGIYCHVRHELKGNIPQSQLALEWKAKYIERNKNEIQRFIEARLEQVPQAAASWSELYSAFCDFAEYRVDEFGIPTEKNSLTQRKFTARMKSYFALNGPNADVISINGKATRGLKGYRVRADDSASRPAQASRENPPPPEDNPFEGYEPAPPSGGADYDIF